MFRDLCPALANKTYFNQAAYRKIPFIAMVSKEAGEHSTNASTNAWGFRLPHEAGQARDLAS